MAKILFETTLILLYIRGSCSKNLNQEEINITNETKMSDLSSPGRQQ